MRLWIRLFPILMSCVFASIGLGGCAMAQTGGGGKVADGDKQSESLKAGPEDKKEKVAPGAIDADADPKFIETKSGLKYRVLRKTDKSKPKENDRVKVHYKGWLDNGKIFDSSYRRNEKISFGLKQVIKGWTEGMQYCSNGGMIELEIPYALAYGEFGTPDGSIPPKATLHFIVELYEINGKVD